jgi:hypothetical protein
VEFHQFGGPDVLTEVGCCAQHRQIVWELQSLPMVGGDGGYDNLFAGIMSKLGNPGAGGFDDDTIAATLFLATCMASADHRLKRGSPWFSWDQPYSFVAEAQAEAVQSLLAHALAWMGGTLPHYAYSPAVESTIEAAAAA